MSSRLSIILTVVFAIFVSGRLEAKPYLPQLELSHPDFAFNEMYAESRHHGKTSLERDYENAPLPGNFEIMENEISPAESLQAMEERQLDAVEQAPELLPTPQPYIGDIKSPEYKKSPTNYYMSICHFKICNMGRKRDTRYFYLRELMRELKSQNPRTIHHQIPTPSK